MFLVSGPFVRCCGVACGVHVLWILWEIMARVRASFGALHTGAGLEGVQVHRDMVPVIWCMSVAVARQSFR